MSFTKTHALAIILAAGLSQAVALFQSPLPQTESSLSRDPALVRDWANRLLANDPKVRATAEADLVQVGRGSFPLLRRFLDPEHEDLHVVTFQIIQRIGPPAIPLLVDLLRHEWVSIRRGAISELIDLVPHTETIQPALRRALRDEDPIVAGDAARALGALGKRASPSVGALVNTLSHEDPYVRVYAAEALASIGPSAASATRVLAEALADPIPGVRWAACEALASIGPAAQSAVPQLIEALEDEFLYVRIFAAGALGSIGPKAQSAREALRAAADDPALRDEAEWALSRIAGIKSGAPVASHVVPAPSGAPPLQTTVVQTGNPPVDWDTTTGRNIVWSVALGNETYGRPVAAGDAVYVGTDNARHMNPAYQKDAGVLMAFQAKDGQFLWQDVAPRVERGLREFLLPSTTSTPYVEGNRLYYVTAECQLRSLDTQGFRDGANDGAYQDEVFQDNAAADIVWELDMCGRLGVFPHEATRSDVAPVGDLLMVSTSNGLNEGHTRVPSPRAPSLIAVDKHSATWCGAPSARARRCCTASGPALWRPTSTGACRCSSAEEMAGCGPTTRVRVTKSGDLTATRKMPAGCRAPASFRAVSSLLHRSLPAAGSSWRWDRVLSTATHLHLFARSVPAARETSPRAGSSGLLARSVAWWQRPSRRTVCCTLGTLAEWFIVWTRQPARSSGNTTRTGPFGELPLAGDRLYVGNEDGTMTILVPDGERNCWESRDGWGALFASVARRRCALADHFKAVVPHRDKALILNANFFCPS